MQDVVIVGQRFLLKEPEMTPLGSPAPARLPDLQFPEQRFPDAIFALVHLLARETAREEFEARCTARHEGH
jgi:hypothetical protein